MHAHDEFIVMMSSLSGAVAIVSLDHHCSSSQGNVEEAAVLVMMMTTAMVVHRASRAE
jgi:hypothetical protein